MKLTDKEIKLTLTALEIAYHNHRNSGNSATTPISKEIILLHSKFLEQLSEIERKEYSFAF